MRSKQEMLDLILGVARADERIRAVYMNGSRANPNVPEDRYQDFDIAYVVSDTAPFLEDRAWVSVFGEFLMVQEPDLNGRAWGEDLDFSRSYGWLMLLEDGNRIDLHIEIPDVTRDAYTADGLTVPLLDKDGILPPIPPPSDREYWVLAPSKDQYGAYCNNFWWCLNNVAKGIARDQLPYAMDMFGMIRRDMLGGMLEWFIGTRTGFSVSVGMMGKYFKKYLPGAMYGMYVKTYSDGEYRNLWDAVFAACGLFRIAAGEVADHFKYSYNHTDDANMVAYLERIRAETGLT